MFVSVRIAFVSVLHFDWRYVSIGDKIANQHGFLLTCDTAVAGHKQRVDPWVFDNVLPMDGVGVTQELVVVNVHTSTQDLCGDRRDTAIIDVWWNRTTTLSVSRMCFIWQSHHLSLCTRVRAFILGIIKN